MQDDIRWKQRFYSYKRVFSLLERTLKIEHPSEAERGDATQVVNH